MEGYESSGHLKSRELGTLENKEWGLEEEKSHLAD